MRVPGKGILVTICLHIVTNSPVSSADKTATSASDVVQAWTEGMWWITLLDGPVPVMDLIYTGGIIISFAIAVSQAENATNKPV